MTTSTIRFSLGGFLASLVVGLTLIGGVSQAQSAVVFMTADDPSLDSHLHRFDNGVETFAVAANGFDAFLGVTFTNGEVLVGDYLEDRIERFAPDGTYLGFFTGPTAGSPSFMESDSSGNVYTTLYNFGLGTPVGGRRYNAAGVQTGTFPATRGIDADAAGNVYTINGGSLVKYAPNGSSLGGIAVGGMPWDLAIDEAGNRLFLADLTNTIKIYDISGAGLLPAGGLLTSVSAEIQGVHFASESGNILATDMGRLSGDSRGLEYSPAGVLLREYRPSNVFIASDIVTMVPEPSTLALLFAGLIGFVMSGRARRTSAGCG